MKTLVQGGAETIFVVDTDPKAWSTAIAMLGGLGYQVLKADDVNQARATLGSGVNVDLLFSDVGTPGSVEAQPGYGQDAIISRQQLRPGRRVRARPSCVGGYLDGSGTKLARSPDQQCGVRHRRFCRQYCGPRCDAAAVYCDAALSERERVRNITSSSLARTAARNAVRCRARAV